MTRHRGPHAYVYDVVDEVMRWQEDRANGSLELYCPRYRWEPNTQRPPICHDCLEPAFARLVTEGARDDEILPAFTDWPIPDRRWLETTLARLRGAPRPEDAWTPKARRVIPKILEHVDAERRRGRRPQTYSKLAELHGIDRGSLTDWIGRGWLTLRD